MYTGILHTHTLAVILFLIIYLVKTFLLLSNKESALDNFTRKVKVPEMIISFTFLATGIYLLAKSGTADIFIYIKLALVVLSIPLAIVGFKKKNKVLAVIAIVFLIAAYGLAEMHKGRVRRGAAVAKSVSVDGKELYNSYCVQCHGEKGNAGLSGAADLSSSYLTREQKLVIIMNGKNAMPAYKDQLSQEQIEAVSTYIDQLHQ